MDHFNQVAKGWDQNPFIVRMSTKVCKLFSTFLPEDKSDYKICDFGSGTGLVGLYFLQRAKELLAIDPSENMIKQLHSKVSDPRISTVCADLIEQKDAFKPEWKEHFDLVVSSMVMHHIKDTKKALTLLYSMLEQNGTLLFCDMHKMPDTPLFHNKSIQVDHPNGFGKQEMKNLLESVGFKHVEAIIFDFEKVAEDINQTKMFELIIFKAEK